MTAVVSSLIFSLPPIANGQDQSADELRKEIEAKGAELQKLEEEAQKYRGEIVEHQEQGRNLKEELKRVDRVINQVRRDIAITEQRLKKTELEISSLALEISGKGGSIQKLRSGLAGLVQVLHDREGTSLIEILVKSSVLSDFFQQLDYYSFIEEKILDSLDYLRELQRDLTIKKSEQEKKQKEAEGLKRLLGGRKNTLTTERADRNLILKQTQNQERKYQELLRDRETKIAALADEIREIEGKLQITIDTSLLPQKGSGILGYPLPNITLRSCRSLKELLNCITQFFGYTSFAAVGGYGGKGHNGTDFRAAFGTPVIAAEDGIIEGVGDTDVGCRGASYGKWIIVKHPNNLSTLYAHLAAIEVGRGQNINRGNRIGLSGRSGYATGPHLHFSVFASQAVRIESIRSRVCGRQMILPISAINGYLNPLDYL